MEHGALSLLTISINLHKVLFQNVRPLNYFLHYHCSFWLVMSIYYFTLFQNTKELQNTIETLKLDSSRFVLALLIHYVVVLVLRPGHTGRDNEIENENNKNAFPRLVE